MAHPRDEAYLRRIQEHFARRDSSRICSPAPISRPPRVPTRVPSPQPPQQPPRGRSEPPARRIPNNQNDHHDIDEESSQGDWNADRSEFRAIPIIPLYSNDQRSSRNDVHLGENVIQVANHPVAPIVPAVAPAPAPVRSAAVASNSNPRANPRLPVQQPRPLMFAAANRNGNHSQQRSVSAHRLALTNRPRPPGNRVENSNRFGAWVPPFNSQRNSTIRATNGNREQRPVAPQRAPSAPRRPSPRENTRNNGMVTNRDVAPVQTIPVHDYDGFLENRQRQMRQAAAQNPRPRPISPPISETPVPDQSSWFDDPWPDPDNVRYPRHPSSDEELELDVNEPILASSGPAFEPVATRTPPRSAEQTLRGTRAITPTASRRESDVPRVVQRPLGRHLAPNRPNPPVPQPMIQYDGNRARSPRFAREVPSPRATTPRPQSSSSHRQPALQEWDIPERQTPERSNAYIPQILRDIQNLPDLGMPDDDDIWGLQNDTTAAFEPDQPAPRQPQSILIRRPNDIPPEQLARNQQEESLPRVDLSQLTAESLEGKTEAEFQAIVNAMYEGTPREKFRETYPFLAEGIVQKDSDSPHMLKVFSSRVGKVLIQDNAARNSVDYVYFLVVRAGKFRGFVWDLHPAHIISAKFPSEHRIVIRGYAILAHANGNKSTNKKMESGWVTWNDSMGLMSLTVGSARTSLKKHSDWEKQLDIVSIGASFENNRFIVTSVVALTNFEVKKKYFPEEVFLVQDMLYRSTNDGDLMFYSPSLDINVSMKHNLLEDFDDSEQRNYEIVVVPTFPRSTCLEFRGILLISFPVTFWSKEKEWIRERLLKKTETYQKDIDAIRRASPQSPAQVAPTSRSSNRALPPRAK